MYCVVRHCKSFWKPKSNIKFHSFPKNEVRRQKWLSLVPLKGKFSESFKICSLHFKSEDYEPERPGYLISTASPFFISEVCDCDTSVPCHCMSPAERMRYPELNFVETVQVENNYEQVNIEDYEQDSKENVCRVCLATDTKLYDMNNYNLKILYEELTHCNLTDGAVHWLCWECAFRLLSCTKFRRKALRSQALLEQLPCDRYDYMQQLQAIDRQKNNLASTLACKSFTNHIDLHIQSENQTNVENHTNYDDFHSHGNNEVNTPSDELRHEPIQEININDVKSDHETANDVHFDLETSSDEALIKHKKTKKAKKKKNEPKIDRRRKPASLVLNEELFTIVDLSLDEQLEEIRKRKETANYKNSVFKCDDCFKGFLDEDAYNSHRIRHTDQCGTFVCLVCKTHFKSHHVMRTHAASHAQRFRCLCCPYVTSRRNAAKLHEEWHNGTRYQCPHCQEDFVKFSTYMGHIRIKHPSDWVCALCGYSFVSEKGLALHKKLKHRFHQQHIPENGPYCQQCDVRFASQEALERHTQLSARHDTDKKEECKKRNRRSASECERDGKTRRTRQEKPEGPIACEQCDMQLPDSLSYYRHFRRTHPDKNRTKYPSMKSKSMCEVCGKMFQSLALLHDHSFTHTDAKTFKCQQCGKTFQRKYRLIAHRRVHRAPRAGHACGTCGKRFATASNRQRHMFTHTGLKPFKCEMCGKCFKHASEKRAHITYVHLKKPWPKRARGRRQVQSTQLMPGDLEPAPLWATCDPKMAGLDKPMYTSIL